jgi:xylan 1,4-beta-xylosidase
MNYPHPYLELYNAARDGLKSVDPSLRIGGPVTMQCQYIGEFVSDTNGKFDFISTHLYPTDPNCTWPAPGSGDIDCFANTIKAAKAKVPAGVDFYLTEYNAGLFNASLLYSAYAAAFVFRNVPLLHGVLDIWSYWTFSDIFEENGMHSAPFEGFNYGMQTVRGVKKPVYRAFQLLKDAGKTFDILNFTNSGPNTTLAGFYTPVGNSNISVFLSNFAPLGFAIETEIVSIPFSPATTCANSAVHAHIIDDTTTNPHHAWEQLGRPAYPTHTQLAILNQASFPATKVVPIVQQANGDCMIQITSRAYSAIRLDIQF